MISPADEFGPVLSGRFLAEDLRQRIQDALEAGQNVVVDFTGVDAMSPSFADELFAKLPSELVSSGRVRFRGLSEDLDAIIRFVVEGRQAGV